MAFLQCRREQGDVEQLKVSIFGGVVAKCEFKTLIYKK
jgi:hypothetical protein